MEAEIGLGASFGAGLVSFLSPCILPLVPPYLCFLASTSLSELTAERTAGTRVLGRAIAFVVGFACVFVALGAGASAIGQLVSDRLGLLSRIAGVIIIVLGLNMAGIFRIPVLMRHARFETAARPAGMLGAFAVGLAFGFGWTPCVGPVLASILLLAGTEATVGRGAGLLTAYAAGIGVPFVAAALFTGSFLRLAARFRAHLAVVEKAMGFVLVGTGLLVFLGAMPVIGGWLLEYVPVLGRIG
ncbi:MAG: cytochrome c biogenesis protein CcdA [Xanthobacteraceae bacterium]